MPQVARSSPCTAQAPAVPTPTAGAKREAKMTPGERCTEIVAVLADAIFARIIADHAGRRRVPPGAPADRG